MSLFGDERRSWRLYLKVIETMTGGDQSAAGEVMQPLAVMKFADWDTNAPYFNQRRQFVFANDVMKWGGLGTRTGTSLDRVYGDYLNRLMNWISSTAPQTPELSEEEKQKVQRFSLLQSEESRQKDYYYSLVDQDWERYKVAHSSDPNHLTRDQFNSQNSNYVIGLGHERMADSYAYNILKIMSRIDPDMDLINTALIDYKSPDNKILLPEIIEDENAPNRWVSARKQRIAGDILRFKKGANSKGQTINEMYSESTTIDTKWGGNAGISVGIFSFGGSASSEHLQQEATQKATSVTIQFENFGEFAIERGDWFSQYVIDRYGKHLPEFWGPQGYLSVIPNSVILAKGITINIVTDDTHTTHCEDHFRSGGSIGFGPFSFGSSYSRDYIHSTFENSGNNFTMKSTNDDVYIVGYRCVTPNVTNADLAYHNNLMTKQMQWRKLKLESESFSFSGS